MLVTRCTCTRISYSSLCPSKSTPSFRVSSAKVSNSVHIRSEPTEAMFPRASLCNGSNSMGMPSGVMHDGEMVSLRGSDSGSKHGSFHKIFLLRGPDGGGGDRTILVRNFDCADGDTTSSRWSCLACSRCFLCSSINHRSSISTQVEPIKLEDSLSGVCHNSMVKEAGPGMSASNCNWKYKFAELREQVTSLSCSLLSSCVPILPMTRNLPGFNIVRPCTVRKLHVTLTAPCFHNRSTGSIPLSTSEVDVPLDWPPGPLLWSVSGIFTQTACPFNKHCTEGASTSSSGSSIGTRKFNKRPKTMSFTTDRSSNPGFFSIARTSGKLSSSTVRYQFLVEQRS
mmetsp:Transcript_128089/g.323395  ORF Transcript_128089/g.323395 Transcript_128089/m.323395 type:complete len:340 (-) Transcript_128089:291-1310(-)